MTFPDPSPDDRTGGIELRVIGGRAPKNWVATDEEEVVRLTKLPPKVRHLDELREAQDDEVPAPAATSARPPRRRKLKTRELSWIFGSSVFLLMLAGIIGAMTMDREVPGEREPHISRFEVARVESGTPIEALANHTETYLEEAHQILGRYRQSESIDEVVPLVRRGEELRSRIQKFWQPLELSASAAHRLQVNLFERGGTAWMELAGHDDRERPIHLKFVLEPEGLVFDWAASFAIGEVEFSRLTELDPEREVEVRALVSHDHFHDLRWPESEFRCFKLQHPDGTLTLWGYAARDSAVADQLSRELPDRASLTGLADPAALTLRIQNRGQASSRQFEIQEIISPTWIK